MIAKNLFGLMIILFFIVLYMQTETRNIYSEINLLMEQSKQGQL